MSTEEPVLVPSSGWLPFHTRLVPRQRFGLGRCESGDATSFRFFGRFQKRFDGHTANAIRFQSDWQDLAERSRVMVEIIAGRLKQVDELRKMLAEAQKKSGARMSRRSSNGCSPRALYKSQSTTFAGTIGSDW